MKNHHPAETKLVFAHRAVTLAICAALGIVRIPIAAGADTPAPAPKPPAARVVVPVRPAVVQPQRPLPPNSSPNPLARLLGSSAPAANRIVPANPASGTAAQQNLRTTQRPTFTNPFQRQTTTSATPRSTTAQRPMPIPAVSRSTPTRAAPAGGFSRQANGSIVRTAPDGSIIDVHNPRTGVSVHHALDGSRLITVEHPDHSRVYIPAKGMQYVQHPYMFKGRQMENRTMVVAGRTFHQIYRPYAYRNSTLDVYATSRYYAPAMYQWAGSQLRTPDKFAWAFASNPTPWYSHYQGYFTPDTSYQTPAAWLTDYMLAATLSSSFSTENGLGDPSPAIDAPITPEVKHALTTEVARQVKIEALEAQQNDRNLDPPAAQGSVVQTLADRQAHVFVVSASLDLSDPDGRRCSVSEGDVVQVTSDSRGDGSTVNAVILASKGGVECGRSAQVQVALQEVQEMQNHMRETIDQGLASTKMAKEVPSKVAAFATAAPPADANAESEIKQQQDIAAEADS